MTDPTADPHGTPPFAHADRDAPLRATEDDPATDEAARRDLAIRGAAGGGALSGSAGYAGGALAGTGGAIGVRMTDDDTGGDAIEPDAPVPGDEVTTGPRDTPGVDDPVGPTEVGGPDRPDD